MEIHTSSPDVTVEGPYTVYLKAISFVDNSMLKDMSTGTHILEDIEFSIDYESTEDDFFDQAIKIMQAATYASFYYEAMKGEDVEDVTIIFPSNEGPHYLPLIKYIHIPGDVSNETTYVEGYESWDVITHEYGHHVSYEEGWIDSPNGGHYSHEDMAEHYKSHFLDIGFDCDLDCAKKAGLIIESQCKRKGMQLAWGEGYATFFGIAAQRYCQELWFEQNSAGFYTHRIFTFGNAILEYGEQDVSVSRFESKGDATGQNCEELVSCVLFEMYCDAAKPNVGDLALGDHAMWNIMKSCQAKTLYEFTNYFNNSYAKKYTSKLGEILYRNYQATSAPRIREQNGVVEFHFDWEDLNSAGYFNARKFQVNFYDEQYNLITSTEPDTAPLNFIYIDSSLWSTILNNRDSVYVSITTYEHDGNINNTSAGGYYITQYESALAEFTNPSIATEVYYNTHPNIDLGNGECEWFKFTAPHTTTYTFSTLGNDDVYVELFGFTVPNESQSGLLNQINTDNFEITINYDTVVLDLKEGETVYIRIREANYGSLTDASLRIEHECTYNTMYAKYSATQHKATCFCGNTRYESHIFLTDGIGIRCKGCGYFTTGPGAIVKPFSSESGIDSTDYVCYYVDEDKKY